MVEARDRRHTIFVEVLEALPIGSAVLFDVRIDPVRSERPVCDPTAPRALVGVRVPFGQEPHRAVDVEVVVAVEVFTIGLAVGVLVRDRTAADTVVARVVSGADVAVVTRHDLGRRRVDTLARDHVARVLGARVPVVARHLPIGAAALTVA